LDGDQRGDSSSARHKEEDEEEANNFLHSFLALHEETIGKMGWGNPLPLAFSSSTKSPHFLVAFINCQKLLFSPK
jgi:hypothetical protein